MKRTIQVHLGDEARRVGTLRYDRQGARESASFEYNDEWLSHAHRFALAPSLPLVAGPQFHRRKGEASLFHAAIADAEPDGWARKVIQRDHAKRRQQAKRQGESSTLAPLNALDYLLAVDDESRMGALRMQDEAALFQRASEPGHRRTPPLIELRHLLSASRSVETQTETAADLAYLQGRGTSLGGMRPKCTVLDEDGRLCIGKFPSVTDERAVTKGEVLALKLARSAGIRAAEARLIDSEGIPVALIRRFDRPDQGGRLMYVSAATMLGASAEDDQPHAYSELVDALRMNGAEPQDDIEELWRRMAFSILITNVDDHLHNHGFLHMEKGLWKLSPAFDINPFPERARELKTWVSEESGPEATIEALLAVLPYFGLTPLKAGAILAQVEAAVARWRAEGRALGMTEAELEAFEDAFEHPERDAARRASR